MGSARLKSVLDGVLNLVYPPVCQICFEHRSGVADGYVCENCYSGPQGVRFIRPPFCERCGLPYDGEISTSFVCANCDGIRLFFRSARSAVVAKSLFLDVIHRYKYQSQVWFEPFLVGLLERELGPWLKKERWDMLIPVPLHPAKERERGFNQAERLANPLHRLLPLFLRRRLLLPPSLHRQPRVLCLQRPPLSRRSRSSQCRSSA